MQNEKYYELIASEFDWKITNSKIIRAWGFNGTLPGPVLRAKKGDTLVVKVINNLAQPTIVHWHGIRLPALMDGTSEVQKPILPGESFEYRFVVPDAGTFWYHSHKDETSQMERGMYGSLIVEDDTDPVIDGERVLMFDDMKLDSNDNFKEGGRLSRWIERHDGRQGDTLLLNGKEDPVINMNAGQMERWRIINASSGRYLRLRLTGRKLRIIGTDGGLLEVPQELDEILLTPAERIDIIAGPFQEGEQFDIESAPYNRRTKVKSGLVKFASVEVGRPKASVAFIANQLRAIESLAPPDAAATRDVKFSVGPSLKRGIDFLVNGEMHNSDRPVNVGQLQVWEVSNTSLMDHPFHLHGFFFQVIAVNGKAPGFRAWKDTVNLPPRSTVKIAWIPDNRPGRWMYHCHILEHHEAGMMAHFEVVDPERGPQAAATSHHSCKRKDDAVLL